MKRVIQRQITTIKIVSIHLTWAEERENSETTSESEIVSLAQHTFVQQYDPVPDTPFELESILHEHTAPTDASNPDSR